MIDPHMHLDDPRYDGEHDGVLRRMAEAGVTAAVTVGCNKKSSASCMALAENHAQLWASAAVHSHEAGGFDAAGDLPWLTQAMAHPRVVAWGEIGLDFHYDFSPKEAQTAAFAEQLDAACALNKPVILHVREAHGEAYNLLRARKGKLRGVMHCYTGSWEMARQYLDLGLYISLSGAVTFKNARNLWEVARRVPLDRLMAETDAPYLAPEPYRGKRNEPAYVVEVARTIARLRREEGETQDDEAVFAAFEANIAELFGISRG